jgi:NADH-quinone oxidoreductase subunit L
MFFLENAWLIPAVMAASFVLILFFGKRLPHGGAEIGVPAIVTSFGLSVLTAAQWISHVENGGEHGGEETEQAIGGVVAAAGTAAETAEHVVVGPVVRSFTWWQNGGIEFEVGTMVDGLTVMMLFTVTLVSMLVHIYSLEYVKGDRRFTHYYAFLSLFSASMLMLVMAGNILLMLVSWELVGLCSFVLIGHWWEEKANSDAALKAFLTNRVGDVGLIIGVILLFFGAGQTFNIIEINEMAVSGAMSHSLLLAAAVSLTAAVMSKSGQVPLHTWLPDAMAGPTPVSALIHAATMVVAGVFMVARLYGVFFEGYSIGTSSINLLALVGGVTTLLGASMAFVQKDIKKVLAYSTISQLGYMVMALGVGAWTAAVFHLFTHAFFKASLFLGAGSVSHAAHHTFDMTKMGGLRKYMPTTFKTFLIASIALAGLPPFAGFWSKDEILVGSLEGQGSAYPFMLVMGLITAAMTAAYMTRAIYLTFFGEYRGEGTPHESPRLMTVPLWILSGFALFIGFLNLPSFFAKGPVSDYAHKFETWVQPATEGFPEIEIAEFSVPLALGSTLLASLGVVLAYLYYFKGRGPRGLTERNVLARRGYTVLENKYYFDYLYTDVIVGSIKGPIARATYWFNQNVIDRVVDTAGTTSVKAGRLLYRYVDQGVVDRTVNATGAGAEESGQLLRRIQNGRVQQYGVLLFGGTFILAAIFIVII